LFSYLKLFLSARKLFISYLFVKLLSYLINAFEIATIKEQVIAFKNIKFPLILQALKKYISITK
jgi:hypothetical protein